MAGLACLMVGAVTTRLRAAQRHERSEAIGVALDTGTLVLVVAAAVAFADRL